jgi:hypothetical protein
MKLVIIAVFRIPAIGFLLLGAFFRGFSHVRRDGGIVLLSASAVAALVILSFVCAWASPEMRKYFSAETFRFFSDIASGIACLGLYVLIGFSLPENLWLNYSSRQRRKRNCKQL